MFDIKLLSNEIVFALCFALIVVFFITKLNFWKKLPPGPYGLPFVGYFPFLTKNPHLKFIELGKVYGNIFSFQLGSRISVVLNDGQAMREAFSKPEFLARPDVPIFRLTGVSSPFFLNGKVWSEHRRFALHALRDLGMGKSVMQDHIQAEIKYILESIEEKRKEPINIRPLIIPSMSNNISSLAFGKRYDYDDPDRIFLDSLLQRAARFFGQGPLFICFPWILWFPFKLLFNFKIALSTIDNFVFFIKKKIKEHKQTLDENHFRDVIDCYLIEKKSRFMKDPDTTFEDRYLAGIVLSLFGAGSNTVRISVEWCICVLAAYPEVHKKVYSEIVEVIGTERLPGTSDQKNMLYTQAVLQEIQRWKTAIPMNLLRTTLNDVELSGFHIPKDTLVFGNIWAAHHDPKCWNQPEIFNPNRFLSTDGKTILKNDNYLPFSYGKRSCPGEGFAVLEVFLYVTSILQKYLIKPIANTTVDLEGEVTLGYDPKPQQLLYIPREN